MKLKELFDLISYSLKRFLLDFLDIFGEFKKPKTWLYVMITLLLLGLFMNNKDLVMFTAPSIIIIYIIRQKIDGSYKSDKFERDIMKGKDSYIVEEYYQKYKVDCYHKKIDYLEFSKWKEEEQRKIYLKNQD